MKLLFIDDSKPFRKNLISLMHQMNFDVEVRDVNNPEEAREVLIDYVPEFVILDISMPKENGISYLKDLRPLIGNAKIAMVTNFSFKKFEEQCITLGADYFFDKTFDIDELLEVIKNLSENNIEELA